MELIGCSVEDFKKSFESKFTPQMTWEDVMTAQIHIDHKIPCASFDFKDPAQQRICFHYSNLQPLWATTAIARAHGDMTSIGNLEKGDSMPDIK